MAWMDLTGLDGGGVVEVDASPATLTADRIRAQNPSATTFRLVVLDQATNTVTWTTLVPAGATRQNSTTTLPAGILRPVPVLNDAGQAIPGQLSFDVGMQVYPANATGGPV